MTILAIISLVLLFMGVFFAKVLQRSYVDTLTDILRREALLFAEAIRDPAVMENPAELTRRAEFYADSVEARITVIDRDGRILTDTASDPARMENHADRPEFQRALAGETGVSHRFSETIGQNMVYVAVPVRDHGEIIGAVRTSMSMQEIEQAIHQLWYSLGTGLFFTLVIGTIVSSRLAYGITEPITEITRVARNITQRQYESRVRLKTGDEIGELAEAINFMASSLEQQMYEISENQQRLLGVLTTMESGVLFVTENRRIMLVNPAVEKMLGTPRHELVGRLHIEAGKNFGLSQYIDRCMDTGEKFRQEVHIYYPQERILDVNFAPYLSLKGEIKGVVAVLHDITEIRRLEKIRSELVANVSHELRTPITSIKGFAETLLDGAMQDEETRRHFLQIIYDESERLVRLVKDILDLSRIEQRRLPLNIVRVNVYQEVAETVTLVQEQLQRKALTLTMPTDLNAEVMADRDALQQILLNLVANAIAYTPDGGKIAITIERDDARVHIHVSDTGIGIPERDLGRIFERFYRVDKARSRDSGGTGLGLAIVKHLVENLNGSIRVESREGEGSIFTVTLPAPSETTRLS